MFALSPEKVALMVNFMSVFSSAFTILFLFWTLTLLMRKLPAFKSLDTTYQRITFFGSASVGALAFVFPIAFGLMQSKRRYMQWQHLFSL